MADQLQIRRGNSTETAAFTGAQGELTLNTETNRIHSHDGVTAGGFATSSLADINNTTIYYNDDTGGGSAADIYILAPKGNTRTPTSYLDGVTLGFVTVNANTGPSTVNWGGIGIKNVKLSGGDDPAAGSILGRVELVFDSANDWFELQPKDNLLQVVRSATGEVATGSTVIPFDDSIPQITEGDEYITVAITPKSATSRLVINSTIHMSNSNLGSYDIVALFKDSVVESLASGANYSEDSDRMREVSLSHEVVSGTTSSITFRIRAGGSSVGTTTFNGVSGARMLGGVLSSFISVTEYS